MVLWNSLREIAREVDDLWVVMEDFNFILYNTKKSGNLVPSLSKLVDFRVCIYRCELYELPNTSYPLHGPINKVIHQFFPSWIECFVI